MLTRESDPYSGREFMSEVKRLWFGAALKSGRTRTSAMMQIIGGTPRPTEPTQTLCDGYVRLMKFHDREPELIVSKLEDFWPDFFEDMSWLRNPLLMTPEKMLTNKKALVGEWCHSHLRLGLAAYPKPNLRKKKDKPASDHLGPPII